MSHTLIDAPDLAAMLNDPATDLLVLDCRFSLAAPEAGRQAHQAGHVPGALYAHLDQDLSGPKTGLNGRHPLPTPDAFIATLRHWGLRDDTEVVAYDDAGGMFAARAWWMLRWVGHAKVRVLDGGWSRWQAQGGAVSTGASILRTPPRTPSMVTLTPSEPHSPILIDFVQAKLGHPGALQLVDARAPDRFRGENETLDPVGGHIPGAVNRFFQLNLAEDGRFKPPQLLRDEFNALLGPRALHTVVHQCGSGVTACHNLLAMAHAGLHGSRLYAGSWSEWCADQGRL